jgi:cytochrome c oxidase subunit 1
MFASTQVDYLIWGGVMTALFAGLHFWWPKMTGRMYNRFLARFSPLFIFFGFFGTFFPQFVLGYLGMPRRYHQYPEEWQMLNVLSSAGASLLAIGYILPVIYLVYSFFWGPVAGSNPWNAKGLEWQTTSPPDQHNFTEVPIVEDVYDYASDRKRPELTGQEEPQGV